MTANVTWRCSDLGNKDTSSVFFFYVIYHYGKHLVQEAPNFVTPESMVQRTFAKSVPPRPTQLQRVQNIGIIHLNWSENVNNNLKKLSQLFKKNCRYQKTKSNLGKRNMWVR